VVDYRQDEEGICLFWRVRRVMPVQITPKQLIFNDGATICALKNAGSGLVAYKIRVNVPHTFHVNPAEGFVVCGESVDVTMALKQATSVDKLSDKVKNAKFQFETAELTADEEATFQGQEPRKVSPIPSILSYF
jgi:hypothetical protein